MTKVTKKSEITFDGTDPSGTLVEFQYNYLDRTTNTARTLKFTNEGVLTGCPDKQNDNVERFFTKDGSMGFEIFYPDQAQGRNKVEVRLTLPLPNSGGYIQVDVIDGQPLPVYIRYVLKSQDGTTFIASLIPGKPKSPPLFYFSNPKLGTLATTGREFRYMFPGTQSGFIYSYDAHGKSQFQVRLPMFDATKDAVVTLKKDKGGGSYLEKKIPTDLGNLVITSRGTVGVSWDVDDYGSSVTLEVGANKTVVVTINGFLNHESQISNLTFAGEFGEHKLVVSGALNMTGKQIAARVANENSYLSRFLQLVDNVTLRAEIEEDDKGRAHWGVFGGIIFRW